MEMVARIVDIATLDTDAIVNAANEALAPGGGVCGAIHRAAGPELARACAAIGACPTGEARLTPGFRLPARFVIHAVGPVWKGGRSGERGLLRQTYRSAIPVWRGGSAGEAALLASAYRFSLRLAAEHEFEHIAFPAISTGIYGYPRAEATAIAVRAVREADRPGARPRRVVFAWFGPDVARAYGEAGVPSPS